MGLRVLAVILFAALGVSARNHPVVLVTDCGTEVDDQWALAWLLKDPQFDLKGIVTTHAPNLKPPASETSAACARQIVQLAGARTPVSAGSPVPLDRLPRPLPSDGSRFLLDISRGYSPSNRLPVLVIGAATDVATAILVDRDLPNRIEVISMGFKNWPDGGEEWNLKNDPAAYQVILDSTVPLTIGSTYVTRQYLTVNVPVARQILGENGKVGEFLVNLLDNWIKANAQMASQTAGPDAWVLWDLVAPACLLGYTRAKEVERPMLNTADLTFLHPPTTRKIRWIEWIDRNKVFSAIHANVK